MVGSRFQALIYVENVHVDELKSKEILLWYPARYLISPVQVDYCSAKYFWDNKWKIKIHLCVKFLIGRSVEAILVIHKMNKYGCLWHLGESRGLISPSVNCGSITICECTRVIELYWGSGIVNDQYISAFPRCLWSLLTFQDTSSHKTTQTASWWSEFGSKIRQ